ncbi:hypothetical protein DFR69_12056 [Nocardia neocaledoniensis]|uniref:Uncharacterized protein n=2 Tax=Nocardia neocaledoniensis TaxID=236511 RepID=A0A317N694_9NOCA|nr:hypothetical protein [Nocardia neocaledoniensis]PWV67658.1 hypothetical protein DFR69_12056 [Nocardia neocaledoniensis]
MAESSRTRVIAIAAVLAALLALVVALGLVMRANQGDENDRVNQMGAESPVSADEASGQAVAFAPPWPARRVGGNCSAGGIVAHWRVDEAGAWNCTVTTPDAAVPPAPAPPPPPPEPEPIQAPPPPVNEPPVYEPPAYEPPPPPEPEPVPAPEPLPAPPPPPPPPVIQLPFPLPPIFVPPAAAVRP